MTMNSGSLLSVEHSHYGIRETTEGVTPIIPELQFVGHVRYHTARPSFFNKHQHPDILEIFYIVQGKVSWWVEGISHAVSGNELFLVWPRELHGARDNIVEPSEYYWIQAHLPSLGKGVHQGGTNPLKAILHQRPERKFRGTTALLPLYQSLLNEHAQADPCREFVVRETLHLLLSYVLRYSQVSLSPRVHHIQLNRAIQWARENVAEATTEGMIHASGLDSTAFYKSFRLLAGSSPKQYLIRLRLQNAKELLAQNRSVTEIAHQLGFSSSQYFATVFRKYEGLSPSDFTNKIHQTYPIGNHGRRSHE
jgi:AraC-like DNA-binding protein/mannose-6-phosphate isomerase-like protein (cupin superfamily)